jgi:fructokinase
MISSVGNDENGRLILEYLEDKELGISGVILNTENPTSCVTISLDKRGSAFYSIEYPCAWDFIEVNTVVNEIVRNSEVFIFGSLAARNEVTRNALNTLLELAPYKVFDVNLRAPHYSYKMVRELIEKANFVKFNDDEIAEISHAMGCDSVDLEDQVLFISDKFDVDSVCVTLGSNGALLLQDGKLYRHGGFKVKVKDTVGAGDSFLASLIDQLFKGISALKALEFACAMGALVASKEGANPSIEIEEILSIQQN